MAWELKSAAFQANETIPRQYTCEGKDVSPPLEWTEPPQGTKSIALICDDPDAPMGTWVHWVLWNLPPETRQLAEGALTSEKLPNGAQQGITDFKRVGYGGPCPPPGPVHRYFFKLYALDAAVNLQPRATKAQLLKAMEGHMLAEAQLIGRYKR